MSYKERRKEISFSSFALLFFALAIVYFYISYYVPPTQVFLYSKNHAAEYVLPNGLKLIVKEDHRNPIVTVQMCYKVGSSYEPSELAGISHMLEHMLFIEDKTYYVSPWVKFIDSYYDKKKNHHNDFLSEILFEEGAIVNARTSENYTVYYGLFPSSSVDLALKLEAKRMVSRAPIAENKLAAEKIVITYEDKEYFVGNLQQSLQSKFNTIAYLASAYKNPILGWQDNRQNLTTEDLENWRNIWYVPNNAVLVVVGDVDRNDIYLLVNKYFGFIKPGKLPEIKSPPDIDNDIGERRIIIHASADDKPYLIMGYKVPSMQTATINSEPYALLVTCELLNYFLLSKEVDENFATNSIDAQYNMYHRFDTVFLIEGQTSGPDALQTMESMISKNIETMKNKLFTAQELEQAKMRIISNTIYDNDSLGKQAQWIIMPESIGMDWGKNQQEYIEKIKSISSEQVRNIAKKYFIKNRMIVAAISPQHASNNKKSNE